MFVPDIHLEKESPYKFYLYKEIFNNTCLTNINSKYNKYLFIINKNNFETKIIYDEDNININLLCFWNKKKKVYMNYTNNNTIKIYTEIKNAICYITDKDMNWYIIKIDKIKQDGTINCVTEKIQEKKELIKKKQYKEYRYNFFLCNKFNINKKIKYDIRKI